MTTPKNPIERERPKFFLSVFRCPAHPGFWTLCIDDVEGIGVRLLGSKCCPDMYRDRQVRWGLTQSRCDAIIREVEDARG